MTYCSQIIWNENPVIAVNDALHDWHGIVSSGIGGPVAIFSIFDCVSSISTYCFLFVKSLVFTNSNGVP